MADIVKLIYKGDEMSQGGGSGSSNVEVLPITTTSDIAGAQAVLDAVLAGKYVIVEYKASASTQNIHYYYLSNSVIGSNARLRYVGMGYSNGTGSTQEPVTGQNTGYFISLNGLSIWHNGTTVSEVTEFKDNQIWISGYTD